MFKRNTTPTETQQPIQAVERITSVLGSGVIWHGSINGSGGVRIIGDDHIITNNYIDGMDRGAFWITSGIPTPSSKVTFKLATA